MLIGVTCPIAVGTHPVEDVPVGLHSIPKLHHIGDLFAVEVLRT